MQSRFKMSLENNESSPKLTNIQIYDDFHSKSKQLTLTLGGKGKGKLRNSSAVKNKALLSKYNSVLDNREHKSNKILELKKITHKYSLNKFKPVKSKTSDLPY